jgi:hypothetical protein
MINKELLLKLYMDRVKQIGEDLEDKTTLVPYEIIDIISNIIEENFNKVINLPKVTRFEVIDHQTPETGRVYVKKDCEKVELSIQDFGKTLKVFISRKD